LKYSNKYDFYTSVYPVMKTVALDAIKSSYHILNAKKKCNVFEIFGLDFMIDESFKPWLIEINTNPCL
jgi:tubulin polyglutamylase TTLL1